MFPHGVCVETCWAGEGPNSHSPLDVNSKTKGSWNLTPFPTKTFPPWTFRPMPQDTPVWRKGTGEHGPVRGSGGRPPGRSHATPGDEPSPPGALLGAGLTWARCECLSLSLAHAPASCYQHRQPLGSRMRPSP